MEPEKQKRVDAIALAMRDLLKVIKVVSLYPENNPLPQSLRQTFSDQLEALIEQYGDITIQVSKEELGYDGEVVFVDRSQEESLAGIFFESGITTFTLKSGLDGEEIFKLLDTIKVYVNSPGRKEDLASLLWEANFGRFSFATVEDVALSEYEGDFKIQEIISEGSFNNGRIDGESAELYQSIFDYSEDDSDVRRNEVGTHEKPGEDYTDLSPSQTGSDRNAHGPGRSSGGSFESTIDERSPMFYAVNTGERHQTKLDEGQIDSISAEGAEAADAMGFGSLVGSESSVPNTTLILNDELKLAEEDEETIRNLISKDAEFNMWESTAELLKELLHQETTIQDFTETVTVCEKVISEFLESGHLIEAAQVLRYFQQLEKQISKEKPRWANRLHDARITAGSRDRLQMLCKGLNSSSYISAADLRRYLDIFDWQALAGITELLGQIENEVCRDSVCDYLASRGKENLHTVARGIFDKNPEVVSNSIIIIARVGGDNALNYLRKVVNHENRQVRLDLVLALRDSPDDDVLELLREAVKDKDEEIRREAVNSIVARRGQPAFDVISQILQSEEFGTLEQEDLFSILKAYSILGGDQAVEFLIKSVLRVNPFGVSKLAVLREGCFAALTVNKSDKAEKQLHRVSGNWRPDIRAQAVATIQQRRELMYGAGNE